MELGGIDEVEAVLNAAGLAVGRIRGVADVPLTPWAVERGAVVTVSVEGADDVTLPTVPWRLSGSTAPTANTLGAFGADNDEVLAELLGLGTAEIDELHAQGVLHGSRAATVQQ